MSIEVATDNICDLNQLRLIGVHGHAGVGKDTAVSYLNEKYEKVYGESFARPLKEAAAAAFGLPLWYFNDPDYKEKTESFWGASPRKMAQFVGTELFREHVGKLLDWPEGYDHFWIQRLEGRLTGALIPPESEGYYEPGDTIGISDVRFQDEADWILENGGWIIHIVRPTFEGAVGIPGHLSEAGITIPSTGGNYWIIHNDSTLEAFHTNLDSFAHHIGLTLKAVESESFPL